MISEDDRIGHGVQTGHAAEVGERAVIEGNAVIEAYAHVPDDGCAPPRSAVVSEARGGIPAEAG